MGNRQFFERFCKDRVALVVAIASVTITLSWYSVVALQHLHTNRVASELVAAKQFFSNPNPNHAGSKIFFTQVSDDGITAYVADVTNGRQKFLFNHEQSHLQGVGLMGWSPDDKLFAYSVRSPAGEVVICNGDSGERLDRVSDSKIILESIWLSDETLVYVNSDQNWSVLKRSNNEWNRSRLFATKAEKNTSDLPPAPGSVYGAKRGGAAASGSLIKNLVAISPKTIAWQQGGTILKFDMGSDSPVKVWESTTNVLLNFHFSQNRQAFRLHCQDEEGELVETFYPSFLWHESRVTELERIVPENGFETKSLVFIQDGRGYVRFMHGAGLDLTLVKQDATTNLARLEWQGGVESIIANDNHIYITGSPTNGPPSIWDYDISSKLLNPLVSGLDQPFKYAKSIVITHAIATNDLGVVFSYSLSRPVDFKLGKRYPLVIGFTGFHWRAQEQAIPNSGAYFAALPTIPLAGGEVDVISLCEALKQRPDVDPNEIYIVGVSAGAQIAGNVLMKRPDLWRGAILLSPVVLPDISKLKVKRLLSDSGGNDVYLKTYGGGVENLIRFQDAAAKAGIAVTLAVHESASHVFRSSGSEKERIQEIIEFLRTN